LAKSILIKERDILAWLQLLGRLRSGGSMVQGQSRQILYKTPSPKQSVQNELEVWLK
jgi:hypothetical protein